jgi:predicted NBD/HSP70 family sugar kinase
VGKIDPQQQYQAPLDPGFQPIALSHRNNRGDDSLVIGLERENGRVTRYETAIKTRLDADTLRCVERLVKFLLWARGGWRLYLDGPRAVCEKIQVRPFDLEIMERIYEHRFEIVLGAVPPAHEAGRRLGGYRDGCRLGFDLGASDYKVAAVVNGEVVFSAELPWNPVTQADPEYHYRLLNDGLQKAAAHVPRVEAIGGSTAGAVVDNRLMSASLFRSVPAADYARAKTIFLRLRDEWRVPVEVANDGDVTALAGAMSLGVTGVLGIAMGSSEAAGYIDPQGHMTGWLNELAFTPVDNNPAAAVDEWSGDWGVGAQYFSQQAVNKLLPAAGIKLPAEMGLPERLKEVQALMAKGDPRAAKIYETIGVYLGYTLPLYAEFYRFEHALILGRVTTGKGGDIILDKAREVLHTEFPEMAARLQLHVPDENSRRVGQAVAAASLPEIL